MRLLRKFLYWVHDMKWRDEPQRRVVIAQIRKLS